VTVASSLVSRLYQAANPSAPLFVGRYPVAVPSAAMISSRLPSGSRK
jgi:hypothetical protein